jgi:tetratricopeptide (TPR) repeat protein
MNFWDNIAIRQIDEEIKKAVALKRNGSLAEARVVLEKSLTAHRRSNPAILAPVYKSLGKVLYLQGDYRSAKAHYIEAIQRYETLGNEEQCMETTVHLGTCDSSFLSSPLLAAYLRGLRGEDAWAKAATAEVVNDLLILGEALLTGGAQRNKFASAATPNHGQAMETTMDNICLDMLRLFRELLVRSEAYQPADFADAVARCLLVQLGFSVQMVDEANSLFFVQVESERMENLGSVIDRVVDFIQDSDWQKEWFISAMAAIVQAQRSAAIDDSQRDFIAAFRDFFDMKPSKFEGALDKGFGWGTALTFAAETYRTQLGPN